MSDPSLENHNRLRTKSERVRFLASLQTSAGLMALANAVRDSRLLVDGSIEPAQEERLRDFEDKLRAASGQL